MLTRTVIGQATTVAVGYYNEQGEKFFSAAYEGLDAAITAGEDTRDESGPVEVTYMEVYEDENGNVTGKPTESVQIHEDNSYTVTQYNPDGTVASQQTYGADNQPADSGASSGFEGWGTSAECRAFNLALLENRGLSDLEAGGFVSRFRVNPDPDDPGARPPGQDVPSDLDCLGIENGQALDDAFQCRKVASCAQDALPSGDDCSCRANTGRKPKLACKAQMVCADGASPVAGPTGFCYCNNEGDVLFEEKTLGGGPLPDAIRTYAR